MLRISCLGQLTKRYIWVSRRERHTYRTELAQTNSKTYGKTEHTCRTGTADEPELATFPTAGAHATRGYICPMKTPKKKIVKNRDRSSDGIDASAHLILHSVAQVVVRVRVVCLETQSRAVATDSFLFHSQAARDGTCALNCYSTAVSGDTCNEMRATHVIFRLA